MSLLLNLDKPEIGVNLFFGVLAVLWVIVLPPYMCNPQRGWIFVVHVPPIVRLLRSFSRSLQKWEARCVDLEVCLSTGTRRLHIASLHDEITGATFRKKEVSPPAQDNG